MNKEELLKIANRNPKLVLAHPELTSDLILELVSENKYKMPSNLDFSYLNSKHVNSNKANSWIENRINDLQELNYTQFLAIRNYNNINSNNLKLLYQKTKDTTVVRNINCSSDLLLEILKQIIFDKTSSSKSISILSLILKHKNLPVDILKILGIEVFEVNLNTRSEYKNFCLENNISVKYISNFDIELEDTLLSNPNCPHEYFYKMYEKKEDSIVLCQYPNCPKDIILDSIAFIEETMIEDKSISDIKGIIRFSNLLKNQKIKSDIIKYLWVKVKENYKTDKDIYNLNLLFQYLLNNINTPVSIIQEFLLSKYSEELKILALEHQNCSLTLLCLSLNKDLVTIILTNNNSSKEIWKLAKIHGFI